MSQANFWENQLQANKAVQELKLLKLAVENWQELSDKIKEIKELIEITRQEDSDLVNQIEKNLDDLLKEIDALEFKSLLSSPFDKQSAILSINAGAGGTESCDWVGMLLRMYSRWAENKNYKIKITDMLPGEEAGIKNVTLFVEGPYAYGYLKSERGVHRLVRISPFDSNKRRHTSFASVDVIAEIEDDVELDLKESDLRVDVFCSSGPGGQSVNTTYSAVRITHIPTGIVVACQNERSQYQNKHVALKILRAKLYEKKLKEREEELKSQYGQKLKIEWGSQIRSYVLHPYNMVKDHRTDIETSNAQAVLNGEIDMFIEGFLKKEALQR